jgi:pimeloyl-ACP methyl ester carboxylesterase
VWSADDRFFSTAHGRKIASLVPDSQYVEVDDCYTFVSEDQPDTLAKHIHHFLG